MLGGFCVALLCGFIRKHYITQARNFSGYISLHRRPIYSMARLYGLHHNGESMTVFLPFQSLPVTHLGLPVGVRLTWPQIGPPEPRRFEYSRLFAPREAVQPRPAVTHIRDR